ncbi:uncharacterized protein LOC110437012 isoform X2 [Sorghum bicolor]|uniref:uncharacterized protein LOC110437012 isoform X2 n=1 Tax=Sorghum bicolor TaxID=4558 RepID=UPI000B42533A|nr:uncharacterized protein LOC110437012 isoform X2 [Sorghum bicolor]XP_021320649.1 uncharacterized protein LOC110437012 isoform X2 [Sorghum bicolor]|eukprot:XP_021320648.1 uncharacterized protein LOC110437012 isoform X2 [Sorghum bicolor]
MTAATSVRARTVGPWSSRDPIPSLDDRRDRGHGRPSRPRPQASALALSVPGAAAPRSIRSRTVASHCPCPHATLANPRPHPRAAVTSHCPRGLRCGNGRLQRRVGGPCCHGHHSASSRTHPGNHNSTEGGHGNILDGATKVDHRSMHGMPSASTVTSRPYLVVYLALVVEAETVAAATEDDGIPMVDLLSLCDHHDP